MPQEPDGWDLQRQVDRLRDDLKAVVDRGENHVTEPGLAALLARYDDRLKDLGEDLAQERMMRQGDIVAEQDARKDADTRNEAQIQRLVVNLRWVATAVLLPIALFIANVVLVLR